MKKRAMTRDKARQVRDSGHAKAKLFANFIGLSNDYQNDIKAKKDVIDKNGDAHSIKSGHFWQIFLYSRTRINSDPSFKVMNGIGQLMVNCLDVFPEKRSDYLKEKAVYKNKLGGIMLELKDKMKESYRIEAFLSKAIFNSGEVQYLTINRPDTEKFFVFYYKDVLNILKNNFEIENSKARRKTQFNNQKVVFKIKGINAGELELRNDSDVHYREMKLRFSSSRITNILLEKISSRKEFNHSVSLFGKAINKFN